MIAGFFNDMAVNPFLASGLVAGLLASLACGVMGPYVIARRVVFLAGAIAHIAVGGIGAAIFLKVTYAQTFYWLHPLHGAVVSSLLAAIIIGLVHERVAERMDTLIGAMWAMGMALGIMLIKFTPGYHAELMSYLFGNLAFVGWDEIRLMAFLDVLIIAVTLFCNKRLLAVCLDRQQARLQGVNVVATDILLLSLVALTVICLIQIVGLILVIALLTLPAATASHHCSRMVPIMGVSTLICVLLTTAPRIAVYGTRISPEAAIVLSAGLLYLISIFIRRMRGS